MKKEDFEKLVKEGIEDIPEKFLKKLDNVEIVVEEEPRPHQLESLKRSQGIRLLGLYQGIPQTKRCHYGEVLPDKITIFQKPIEEIALSEKEIKKIVKNTVWHEIAHHFGMTEEQIKKAEKIRRVKKFIP